MKKGQNFNVVVRQVTRLRYRFEEFKQDNLSEQELATADAVSLPRWRRILGTFQIAIPVKSKEDLLEEEQRLYSILKWILQSILKEDRWYDVFSKYVDEIGSRVEGLGGDPGSIPPSATGQWQTPKPYPGGPTKDDRVTFVGKVSGIIYDRFGDFEGFVLDTRDGDHEFYSREHEIEDLASRAWSERIALTVFTSRNNLNRPLSIVLRHAPRPFQG